MRHTRFYLSICFLSITLFLMACHAPEPASTEPETITKDSTVASIEWYDDSTAADLGKNLEVDTIGTGFDWSEGALWIPSLKQLIFSDVPTNKIFQWKEGSTTSVYLTPSGFSDVAHHVRQDGSNGLALDKNGKLILCQSGDRRIARMNAELNDPKPTFTILADKFQGKKFNSPNDLVADRNNNIYFTDPIYGLPGGETDSARELKIEGVYKVDAAGKLSLLIDSIPRPNGIALSPDEKILYIASSDEKKPRWYAYNLNDKGDIVSGKVLLDVSESRQKATVKQGPDGFKVDNKGRIFSSGPDGINIISPAGKLLGLIRVLGRPTSNCSFNEAKDVLYVTADDLILKLRLYK